MNIFFDTEFTGLHKDTTLISIGLVDENGNTFYAELSDYDRNQVNDWIQDNVLAYMKFPDDPSRGIYGSKNNDNIEMYGTRDEVAKTLRGWLDRYDEVQLVSDVCHYDMVLFIDLFGSAFDLPKCVNASCHDINQDIAVHYNVTEAEAFDMSREGMLQMLPEGDKHNALYDAKVIREIYYHIIEK